MIRIALAVGVLVIIVVCIVAMLAYRSNRAISAASPQSVHVILVGASIGQTWGLGGWPARAGMPEFTAEAIAAWQFDKSEAVGEVLMRPRRKFRPTLTYMKSLFQAPPPQAQIVILKECSSYFPGDFEAYKRSMSEWAKQVRTHNIQVVLATVVPVTKTRAAQDPGKQEALLAYNQWVRQYAQEQRFPVLDLEAALRSEAPNFYLRDEFTSGDGSHLNAAAYAVLDGTLRTLLCEMKPVAGCLAAEHTAVPPAGGRPR